MSAFGNRYWYRKFGFRYGGWVVAIAVLTTLAAACDGGREGDRCNPLSTGECGDGLSCQQPATCSENYCCPNPRGSSANPYCTGVACPTADAGQLDATVASDGGAD